MLFTFHISQDSSSFRVSFSSQRNIARNGIRRFRRVLHRTSTWHVTRDVAIILRLFATIAVILKYVCILFGNVTRQRPCPLITPCTTCRYGISRVDDIISRKKRRERGEGRKRITKKAARKKFQRRSSRPVFAERSTKKILSLYRSTERALYDRIKSKGNNFDQVRIRYDKENESDERDLSFQSVESNEIWQGFSSSSVLRSLFLCFVSILIGFFKIRVLRDWTLSPHN